MRAARVEGGSPCIHPHDHGKGIFLLARQFHQGADVVGQQNPGTHPRERHRSAFVNFNFQPVGNEAHDAGRFHPRNLFQLRFPLRQGHEENIAADVAAHDFHHLRAGDVLQAADFDVVAGFDAEAPGALSVVVERGDRDSAEEHDAERDSSPGQASNSFLGK